MKKTIGTDIAFSGNINGPKLCREIEAASITEYTLEMDPDTGELYLTFDDAIEEQINTILAAHDPTPDPEPLSDIEQTQLAVAEAIEKQEADKIEQQLAQAEMFETILQMLEPQGGGE
ncbi:hypothetical protein NE570_21245 [Eubacterium callanderi]|nr:hypothetical protein [Eubacterium callanderi]MCQ5191848.1 hypothetical protein [Eubacterium callanderi]